MEDIPLQCALSCASVLAHRPSMDCPTDYLSFTKDFEEEKPYSNVIPLHIAL